MTWRLTPGDFEHVRWQTALLITDAEHCSIVLAGARGDAAAEFRKIVDGSLSDRVKEGLRQLGCPEELLARAAEEVVGAAAEWIVARDAMLQPTEGSA